MNALLQAVADFVVEDVDLVTGPAALAAARRSLNDSGLLLLGEVHGVRENPLDWSWSRRDEAMAGRILAGSPAGTRTLAVTGKARTPPPAARTLVSRWVPAWPAAAGHAGDTNPLRQWPLLQHAAPPVVAAIRARKALTGAISRQPVTLRAGRAVCMLTAP
jgi:hypothetical protein